MTPLLPIAFIGPLAWTEILIILAAALMIFGGNLPEVALRGVAHFMRFRRAVAKMWRDTGLEDELRRVRREVENSLPREADFEVRPSKLNEARRAAERARLAAARERETGAGSLASEAVEAAGHGPRDTSTEHPSTYDSSSDPDADRRESYAFEPNESAIASGDDFGAGVPVSDAKDDATEPPPGSQPEIPVDDEAK